MLFAVLNETTDVVSHSYANVSSSNLNEENNKVPPKRAREEAKFLRNVTICQKKWPRH